jgi:hypothetical protein
MKIASEPVSVERTETDVAVAGWPLTVSAGPPRGENFTRLSQEGVVPIRGGHALKPACVAPGRCGVIIEPAWWQNLLMMPYG